VLRTNVAYQVGAGDPGLQSPYRVRPSALLLALGGLAAVGVLLSQVGDPTQLAHVLRHANGAWLAVATALSLATNLPFAIALIGTVPRRLPLWPTTLLQVAMSYSNLAVPGVGGLAVQVRFLQRQGVDLASAMAAGGLLSAFGSVTTQIVLFVSASWLAPDSFHLDDIPIAGLTRDIATGLAAIALAFGAAYSVPRVRHLIQEPLSHAASTIWATMRSGRRLTLLIGGNVVTNLLLAACLLACLRAYDATLSFFTALAISTGLTTLTALVPIPGGATALGSLGMSGALSAFGVPDNVAISVALTNQLVVNYLPAVPGWFATRHLLSTDDL
jgi:undecaprenyl-diphosphatase